MLSPPQGEFPDREITTPPWPFHPDGVLFKKCESQDGAPSQQVVAGSVEARVSHQKANTRNIQG